MKETILENLDNIVAESGSFPEFASNYFDYLGNLLKKIDRNALGQFMEELEKAEESQSSIFFIGNGGSAAAASHMAQDFNVGKRIDPKRKNFRAVALTSNSAELTAIANDYGYEEIFLTQLKIHYQPGDKLVAISASGNSPNLVRAAEWVKKQGGVVIGLVGFDGGRIKEISDISIVAETPKGEYGPVEDVHMAIDHLIYTWLRHKAYLNKGQK